MSYTETRYLRAAHSSHLEMNPLEISDVDYLIAAGLCQETLATRLIRLRAAFDHLKRERRAMKLLNGYAEARLQLTRYADAKAYKFPGAKDHQAIADRALDLFLDPTCPSCEGRGFNGGYSGPTLRCAVCRESGKRLLSWPDDSAQEFGSWLLRWMEESIGRAAQDMRRMLREKV